MIIAAGRVLTPTGVLAPGSVTVEGDRVVAVAEGIPAEADWADPHGILVPGFVDLQVNGGVGVDLLDCTAADVASLAMYLATTGTTAFLPTLITSPLDHVRRAVSVIGRAGDGGAEILGVHVEGPALNPERRGAHDPRFLRPPDDPALHQMLAELVSHVRIVTLAPELPGAGELGAWLVDRGVLVSLGHTDATRVQALDAFRWGARMVTHLFNGMRGLHHQEPGVIGAAFDDAGIVCGLIADGIHVHPAVVRLAFRVLGPARVAVVTDAAAAAGMPPGEYRLGSQVVRLKAGDAPRLPEGRLAGSALRMDDAVGNLVAWGIPLADAVQSAAATPARLLGLDDRGAVAPGARADLCVLGSDGRAGLTVVAGRIVYERKPGGA